MNGRIISSLFFKELAAYFKNPLGYIFIIIFLMGIGQLTFEPGRGSFFYLREASMGPFFSYIPWMFLFLIPAVSMRLWSDERKSGTIELLFTMPIKTSEAVLAKYLAALSFVCISLLGSFPMVITIIYLGNPDLGVTFMGYVAAFLLASVLLSIGSFYSALTKNQVVSFILTVVTGLLLIMSSSPPLLEFISTFFPKYFVDLFESLSILNHYENIQKGIFSLGDLWFFSIMIFFWLSGNILILNNNKAL